MILGLHIEFRYNTCKVPIRGNGYENCISIPMKNLPMDTLLYPYLYMWIANFIILMLDGQIPVVVACPYPLPSLVIFAIYHARSKNLSPTLKFCELIHQNLMCSKNWVKYFYTTLELFASWILSRNYTKILM